MGDHGSAASMMPVGVVTPTEGERTPPRRPPWGPALALTFVGTACIGFNTTRVADFPVADVIFLAGAAIVAAQLLMGNTRHLASADMRRAPTEFVVGSLLLLGAGVWSTLWIDEPGASIIILLRFAWLTLVWSWLLRSVVATPLALDRVIGAYRIAVVVSAAAAVAGQFGLIALGEGFGDRQVAFTNHPNHLGGMLAVGLPFVALDTRTTRPQGTQRRGRSLMSRLLLTGFVLFAVTTSGSMTAVAAAVVGMITVLAVNQLTRAAPRRRNGPLVAIVTTFVVFVGLLGLIASGAPAVERFVGYQQGDVGVSGSVEGRGEQDAYVIDRIDHFLVMGVGFGQDENDVEEETGFGVHNNVLKLMYEAGIPAVLGLLILWLLAAQQCWRLLFDTRGTELHMLVVGLSGAFVVATAFAQFHPLAYERYYWFPLVMIGATWSLRRQQLRVAAPPAPLTTAD